MLFSNFEVDQSDTLLGAICFAAVQLQVEKETTPRKYIRWAENDRYSIGEYLSENGNKAAVRS